MSDTEKAKAETYGEIFWHLISQEREWSPASSYTLPAVVVATAIVMGLEKIADAICSGNVRRM